MKTYMKIEIDTWMQNLTVNLDAEPDALEKMHTYSQNLNTNALLATTVCHECFSNL